MRRPVRSLLIAVCIGLLASFGACAGGSDPAGPTGPTGPGGGDGDPGGGGGDPGGGGGDPGGEIPTACERPPRGGFEPEIARLLADLAEQAYEVDGSWRRTEIVSRRSDCWELVRFVEHIDEGAWVDTQLFIAQNAYTGDVVVSFRGSQESTDTWTDLSYANADWTLDDGSVVTESVHGGFDRGYQSVRDEVRDEVMALLAASEAESPRVYFTGHSLGGALATLAALDLATPLMQAGVQRDDVILYTLGAPRSISERLSTAFAQRVPNAYAVTILRDWITHLPESILPGNEWVHIPHTAVLHGGEGQTRVSEGNGADYDGCLGVPLPLDLRHHGIALYQQRLDEIVGVALPTVGLSVSADGNMVLQWNTAVTGPCDWIGLYRGYPTDASDHLGIFSWEWAEDGSPYKTWWAKGDDYYAAYVDEFGKIVQRSEAYVPTTPRVWLSKHDGLLGDWVQLNWSVSDPGENDFVALYDEPPLSAGTDGYLTLQWEWALDGSSHVTNTLWKSGYYIAYVMEDDEDNRRILAWAGPN